MEVVDLSEGPGPDHHVTPESMVEAGRHPGNHVHLVHVHHPPGGVTRPGAPSALQEREGKNIENRNYQKSACN